MINTFQKRLILYLLVLALLTPVGIILPEVFHSGDAWGEWDLETIEKLVGYIPEGMRLLSDLWKAPVPDYNLGGEDSPMAVQIFSYILSAVLGIIIVSAVILLIGRLKNRLKA